MCAFACVGLFNRPWHECIHEVKTVNNVTVSDLSYIIGHSVRKIIPTYILYTD